MKLPSYECHAQNTFDNNKSALIEVMTWCHQATKHYITQCWPRSVLPYRITRPQWVETCRPRHTHMHTHRHTPHRHKHRCHTQTPHTTQTHTRHTDRHTQTQTHAQTDRQTQIDTDRRTQSHTDTYTETDTQMHTHRGVFKQLIWYLTAAKNTQAISVHIGCDDNNLALITVL